jgi:chromosome segregation ATPase
MSEDSIELPSVVRRFKDSTESLEALKETIENLGESQKREADAAQSIEEASRALDSFVDKTAELNVKLEASNAVVVETLDRARQFLVGTDLSKMHGQIEELQQGSTALKEALKHAVHEIEQRNERVAQSQKKDAGQNQEEMKVSLAKVEAQIATLNEATSDAMEELKRSVKESRMKADQANQTREAAESELAELRATIKGLPERHRKKFDV